MKTAMLQIFSFPSFKECAWFWPLLPSCWNFFATIRRRIWPFFDPYPPKNVDVLIWCSLWKFLHLWKFFATTHFQIWPIFDPFPPKNVDVLNWCSLREVLHLPDENCNATDILLYLKNVHDFDPYSPPVEIFLLVSVGKFDKFLTPTPLKMLTS